MITVSISKKLAKEFGISLGNDEGVKADFYVHTIDILDKVLVIIVKPKTYYSYTAIAKSKKGVEFDSILEEKIGASYLRYIVEKNKSELTRISTIGRKYIQLINMRVENTDNPIVLEEIETVANITPWGFLGFKSPAGLEASSGHNKPSCVRREL